MPATRREAKRVARVSVAHRLLHVVLTSELHVVDDNRIVEMAEYNIQVDPSH
jgi:hypothetical protein